jgi:transcriptional regulator with XRE-family HTH domain
MALGEKIRALREARRMTQTELAERAQIGQAIISRLEAGLQHEVRSGVLKRLAEALGCTTDWLVGMHEEDGPLWGPGMADACRLTLPAAPVPQAMAPALL